MSSRGNESRILGPIHYGTVAWQKGRALVFPHLLIGLDCDRATVHYSVLWHTGPCSISSLPLRVKDF